MLNKNYGKLTTSKGIQYAPRSFHENDSLVIPRIDDDDAYFSRGWYKVVNVEPQHDMASQIACIKQWNVDENAKTITAEYDIQPCQKDMCKKAKRYSKLSMTIFLMDQQLWKDVKEFLEKTGYYDLFVMAQYFLDTDEYFQRGIDAFKQAYASEQHPLEELEDTIEAMLNFAFDGYETVNENNEEELVATSIANNAGL